MQKTVLITGATSGIGRAVAINLARQGHHVIIHGRDTKKAEALKQEILSTDATSLVSIVTADLYLQADIHRMCTQLHEQFQHIDILINNAGGLMGKVWESTPDGFEKTFAVNLLAPMLITHWLMDLLVKSNDARIINVSSNSHQLNAKPDFEDLQLVDGYNPLRAYGNAKLFLIWNTQQLVSTLQERGIQNVRAYTVHPGAVATSFGTNSDLGPVLNFLSRLLRPFFRSPESGADTINFLATAQVIPGKSGDYFVDRKPAKISTKYFTPEQAKLVWDYCSVKSGIAAE